VSQEIKCLRIQANFVFVPGFLVHIEVWEVVLLYEMSVCLICCIISPLGIIKQVSYVIYLQVCYELGNNVISIIHNC
jgi:hypothetical protein